MFGGCRPHYRQLSQRLNPHLTSVWGVQATPLIEWSAFEDAVPVYVFYGQEDDIVPPAVATHTVRRLCNALASVGWHLAGLCPPIVGRLDPCVLFCEVFNSQACSPDSMCKSATACQCICPSRYRQRMRKDRHTSRATIGPKNPPKKQKNQNPSCKQNPPCHANGKTR